MVTVTIKENSKQAKAIIEMLKVFPFVEIQDKSEKRYNAETEKAIADAKKGKNLISAKNAKDLIQKLNS